MCDGAVMLGLYWEVIFELWLFVKRHWLTMEICIMYIVRDEVRLRKVVGSKITKEPVICVAYEMVLCYGTGWAWFRSLLIGPSRLVVRQLLIISGDVELNPGPLDHGELNTLSADLLSLKAFNLCLQKLKNCSQKLTTLLLVCM